LNLELYGDFTFAWASLKIINKKYFDKVILRSPLKAKLLMEFANHSEHWRLSAKFGHDVLGNATGWAYMSRRLHTQYHLGTVLFGGEVWGQRGRERFLGDLNNFTWKFIYKLN
jgi:hypothetical protein